MHTHDEVKKAKPRKTVKKATTRKAGEKNGTGSDVTKEKADPDASSDDGKEPSARKTKKPIPSTPPADTENDAGGAEASSDLEASGDSQ